MSKQAIFDVLLQNLIGKKIKVYRKEYTEQEYSPVSTRPKYHYAIEQVYQDSAICEIVDFSLHRIPKTDNPLDNLYSYQLQLSDNGIQGVLEVDLRDIIEFVS